MELLFLIYIINTLNPLHHFLAVVGGISIAVAAVIYFVIAFSFIEDDTEDFRKKAVPYANSVVKVLIFSSILDVVIPNEKTAYMMTAGYVAQHIAQSDTMGKVVSESTIITSKIVTIVNKKLDYYIDESTKEIAEQVTKK